MAASEQTGDPSLRWGEDSALFDDDEARRRLLEAVGRCIAERGHTAIQMADVAQEAGVSRSTIYRYFRTRNELLLELLTRRTDAAFQRIVARLATIADAESALTELVLAPVELVAGNPLNEALFAPESRALLSFAPELAIGTEDLAVKHFGPLMERWIADGQLYRDLDPQEVARWLVSVTNLLLTPPWRGMSRAERASFVERHVVRAIVVGGATSA